MGQKVVRYTGGCACGAVRFEAIDKPLRVGLCHCLTCRKHHGAAFNPFVVFPFEAVFIAGGLRSWRSSEHSTRLSCEVCSSPICQQEDDSGEIELHGGSFDETSLFPPEYENWTLHREDWLPHLGVREHPANVSAEILDQSRHVRSWRQH
mgnify:CR=1 FL=1|jgi:hypothetical protein